MYGTAAFKLRYEMLQSTVEYISNNSIQRKKKREYISLQKVDVGERMYGLSFTCFGAPRLKVEDILKETQRMWVEIP